MSSSPPTPFGVAAYSIEVSSTRDGWTSICPGSSVRPLGEHLEYLLAMVAADTPVRVDLSGVSSLDAGRVQPLIGLARTRRAAGRAGVFIAASSAPARRRLELMSGNLSVFDTAGRGESLVRS